jgi:hypothetical protein
MLKCIDGLDSSEKHETLRKELRDLRALEFKVQRKFPISLPCEIDLLDQLIHFCQICPKENIVSNFSPCVAYYHFPHARKLIEQRIRSIPHRKIHHRYVKRTYYDPESADPYDPVIFQTFQRVNYKILN